MRAWRKNIIITLNTETPEYQRMTTNRWIQHNAIIMHAADTMFMSKCDNTAEGLSAAESGTWA